MSKKQKKKKLEKTYTTTERKNLLGITSDKFTTMSSLKDTLTRSEVSGNKPEFVYYTKKGKIKELKVNKHTKIHFAIKTDIDVYTAVTTSTDSTEYSTAVTLKPVGEVNVLADDNTNVQYSVYEVSFRDFFDSLKREILGDISLPYFYTEDPNTKEKHHVLEVCLENGAIIDKDGKLLTTVRYNL